MFAGDGKVVRSPDRTCSILDKSILIAIASIATSRTRGSSYQLKLINDITTRKSSRATTNRIPNGPFYRRRCCSNYAGEMAEQERSEAEQFVVTGSLLDARRAGADVPLVGQLLQVSARFGPDAVAAFAKHAGDDNPIHLDDNYARRGG